MRKAIQKPDLKSLFFLGALVGLLVALTVYLQSVSQFICARYQAEGLERLLAFIRGSETNCLRGFLYEFQTLIAGLLALAAAAMTIRRMQRDDQNANLRHLREMERVRRPDRLRLERNILPWIDDLRKFPIALDQMKPDGKWHLHDLQACISRYEATGRHWNVISSLDDMVARINDERWMAVEDLIDHPISHLRSEALGCIGKCRAAFIARLVARNPKPAAAQSLQELASHHIESQRAHREASEAAVGFPDHLEQLATVSTKLHSRLISLLQLYDVEIDQVRQS